MDNMLYIIVGLVLILLGAGLVLRKQKAQKPSELQQDKSGKTTATPAPIPATNVEGTTESREDDHKFDHIEAAQRFIDQQRYDKAIEALDRGLSEEPDNSQLTLKLLSIYATINQPENFDKVYNIIKTQNDPNSIEIADELKMLFLEERSQVAAQEAPVEDNTDFDSIDFDLSPSQDDSLSDESIVNPVPSTDSPKTTTSDHTNDSFDLTLSDLESDFEETAATRTTPVTPETIEDESNPTDTSNEDSDLADFNFNFDSTEETSAQAETPNSATEEMASDNEDFVLDFDDLVSDTDQDTDETIVEELIVDNEDDLTDSSNDIETVLESEELTFEENSDNFVIQDSILEEVSTGETSNEVDNLEDISFDEALTEEALAEEALTEEALTEEALAEEALAEEALAEETLAEEALAEEALAEETLAEEALAEETLAEEALAEETLAEEAPTEESGLAPAAPLLFNDNILENNDLADDNAIIDSVTAETPVEAEAKDAVEAEDGFSLRFAENFDFVKSLDSNQVTLDLANQYLQLGEYDSAKRLLNEVIAQGNSEQQSQAQLLLERTA
ncbi:MULTISPECIES: FimV/HubP family polar landmark protein [unclassified Psychrobacter]|uniref:FimV/HubP family polar landmark protein n=2 Tax=Psychrobacter TaxID=497 RepID=UPI004037FA38